jgi:4-hydroxy-tetrahydrodipicolinate reductase
VTVLRIAVLGAGGRMGREVLRAIAAAADCRLAGAALRPGDRGAGHDAGEAAGLAPAGIIASDSAAGAIAGADVAIDFSLAPAIPANLAACRDSGCPLVIGVTGLTTPMREAVEAAARVIPIVLAANLSRGATVLRQLAAAAAASLPGDYDVAILDLHHRRKLDAPSGTALALGEAVAAARGQQSAQRPPGGSGRPEPISFASLRAGDIVGEHAVLFAGPGERIELRHCVTDRATFAAGALAAARWVIAQPPALYGMEEVTAVQSRRRT